MSQPMEFPESPDGSSRRRTRQRLSDVISPIAALLLVTAISIVELTHTLEGATPLWQTGEEPAAIIGDGSSPQHELLDVLAAALLDGGRIVVADGRPVELRIFDSTGSFIGRLGRGGAGRVPPHRVDATGYR